MAETAQLNHERNEIHPGLPAHEYCAPEIFELEKERIFSRCWVCVGRAERLAEPGDFITAEVAGESIIVTRTRELQLAAHYNVCRHRGSLLLEAESGRLKGGIVCPYHAWTYALDGTLVATPNVDAEEGLCRAHYGLRSVHVDTWDGFVFVNLHDTPQSLQAQLGSEPDWPLTFARYGTGELSIGARLVYEVAANWKILFDNFNECLHCPVVHPELVALVPVYRTGRVIEAERPDGGVTLTDGASTFADGGTSRLPFLPGLSELDHRTYSGYSVFPSMMVNLLATGVMAYKAIPRAVDHTTVVSEYLFRPETIAAPGFDPSDMVDFLDRVSRQDWAVCERTQKGVRSRGFRQGVYPSADRYLHTFAKRYLELRGPVP